MVFYLQVVTCDCLEVFFMGGNERRNLTPPEIARRYGVATAKVVRWIHDGELIALNFANRGCTRPRYSITPEALKEFERARTVAPSGGGESVRTLRRRRTPGTVKEFFN
jgi:hypothetical protein